MIEDTIIQQVLDLLTSIGNTIVTEGFRIATRYVYVKGWILAGVGTLSLTLSFVSLIAFIKGIGLCDEKGQEYFDIAEIVTIVSFVACAVLLVIFFITLPKGAMMLLAPEWYAIKSLLSLIR